MKLYSDELVKLMEEAMKESRFQDAADDMKSCLYHANKGMEIYKDTLSAMLLRHDSTEIIERMISGDH